MNESGVRVTCDVDYLCANFGLSTPLYSRVRPDVRDRCQTDRHQTASSLNARWAEALQAVGGRPPQYASAPAS